MTSPISNELQSQMADWRRRAEEGTMTQEDCFKFISLLRQGRMSAATAASSARKTSKAVAPGADDMLGELEGL